MTFMIGPDGQVFEKDQGPNGEAQAKAMKGFNPDSTWTEAKSDPTAVDATASK